MTFLENGEIHTFYHIAKTHLLGELGGLIFRLSLDKWKEIKDLLNCEAEPLFRMERITGWDELPSEYYLLPSEMCEPQYIESNNKG